MKDCLFCKISRRELNSKIVYEDEQCLAIEDINPQAPTHLLVIPKRHIEGLATATDQDGTLLSHLLLTLNRIARDKGLHESGFRVVINSGSGGGQTVFHLHLHLLGGRFMKWPPG